MLEAIVVVGSLIIVVCVVALTITTRPRKFYEIPSAEIARLFRKE